MEHMQRMERIYQREAERMMRLEEEFSREIKRQRRAYHAYKKATITNGFPESGGGGASATESACTDATGTDAAPEAGDGDDDGGDSDSDPDGRHTPSPSLLRASRATRQKTGVNLPPENQDFELWRLPTVIKHYPVSRRTWLEGVKAGIYPKPVKIAARAIAWRASDIRALVASL